MIILVSSVLRPRFREDILRCMAAPFGTRLQFRYRQEHVEATIVDNANSIQGEGIICFADTESTGVCPLLPFRKVSIYCVRKHGTTLTILFIVQEFAQADSSIFTSFVQKAAKGANPAIKGGRVMGHFLFMLTDFNPQILLTATLSAFELIADKLASSVAFKNEPFFWTVLGFFPTSSAPDSYEAQISLPKKLRANSDYELLIYHYHPSPPFPDEIFDLSVSGSGELSISKLDRLIVDCGYDVKAVAITTQGKKWREQKGRIIVGPEGKWSVNLDFVVKSRRMRTAAFVILAGLSISATSIMNLLEEHPINKYAIMVSIVCFGLVAAFFMTLAAERPDSNGD